MDLRRNTLFSLRFSKYYIFVINGDYVRRSLELALTLSLSPDSLSVGNDTGRQFCTFKREQDQRQVVRFEWRSCDVASGI